MPLSHGAGRDVESPQSHRARTEPICHGATETESTKIFATEPQSTNLFATESQRHRDTDVRENVGEDPFTDGRHRRREERRAHGAIFDAQVITYLRVTKKRVGLLINFNSRL